MGRKYNQDEINDILGDLGGVTQKNYTAPTVKSNVAPAMAVVAQQLRTIQPTVTSTQPIPQTSSTVQPKKEKTSILKTLGNVATNMGTGALKGIEGAADTISDLVVNPYERYSNYVIDLVTKGKKTADENLKDLKEMQQRDIKRNLTKEFQDTVGYTETLPEWEKGSLVKSDNFGGQVAQGVGGMVPALLFGSVAGTTPELVNTTNLAGKEKLIASLGNVGRTYASQLPSNLMLGASSYGGGLEEALNQGYDINKARQYGLANAAIEQGTEYLTGGIPGLSGKGGIDNYLEPLIDKSSKGYANNLLKYLYRAGGEGLEETAGTYLDALAQKGILGKDIDWNETNKEALQSGLVGAATGAILDSGQLVGDLGSTRAQNIENKAIENAQKVDTIETQEPKTQQSVDNTKQLEYNKDTNETESVNNDFRAIQEESRRKLNDENWGDSSKAVDEDLRGRIRGTLSEEIKRRGYSDSNNDGVLKLESKGNNFNLYKNVDAETFHDMFEIARTYTDNGELVDLHPINTNEDSLGYNEMNNYLSDDGMQGFSITKDGDVVSVFNADPSRKGFLRSIVGEINNNGKTLDCFNSSKQRLDEIYSKVFGWKTASVMDHNMDYDHDNIAKNHNNPPVSFMVNPQQLKSDVTDADLNKKFGKDQYDEAVAYRSALMKGGEGNKNDFIFGKDGYFQGMREGTSDSSFNNVEEKAKSKKEVTEAAEQIKKQFENKTITNKNGKKESNFYSNITEKSQFIEPETREKLKTEEDIRFYKEVTNEQALNEAVDKIGTTPASQSKALHEFLNKQDQFTATDMAEGWVFLKQYQDAKNYDAMAQVAKKMREMGTKSGQAIQMLSLEARLTPEGMYRFAVNELAEAEQKFNSKKGRKQSEIDRYRDNFQLTPEETEFIKTQMEKVQQMEPGRERDIEVAKINSMLQDKLPHERGRSLKAWMRLSMLFNPKTQVRNVMGNALITPVNALADVAAGITDKIVSKTTGARTIGGPSLGGLAAYGKGAVKGLKQATQDYRLGIDTKNVNQNRFDIGQGKSFNEQHKGPFKNTRNAVARGLNNINDFLGYLMDAGDRMFYQGSVENSLYNQQKLNNTQEVTQEMADIAVNEGLQRTWNDNNQFTQAVLNIRRAINDIGGLMHIKVGEYGLGDLMIPFAKTPANLTKAIVDYSPVGFLNAITEGKDLKRAIATGNYTMQQQHDFSQTVGKAFAGSLLYILGTALAKAKISSGSGDEDKDLKNFMRYNLGIQPYSIKIGNKSFTYDWAQPVAAPLAITADIEKGIDENMTPAQALQQFLTTGFNVLSEQSFLSGVNEVLNNNDGVLQGIEQQVMNMPATAVPTLLKQFTDIVDPTKRQTYSKEGMAEQTKKYAMYKIPSESKKLAPQVDVLGNEIQKYGGDNSAFNIFLNPANTEKGKSSDVSEEIYALYEATGNKNIIPKKVDYSITIDGEKRALTTEEMARWQKASGRYVTENVRKAINDEDYKKLSDEQKASVINGIVNYSYMKSKSDVFGTKLSSYYSGPSNAEKKGIPMYDYYISKVKKG